MSEWLTLFCWLVFAHALADWGLQSQFVAEQKAKRAVVMFMHCTVWTGCVALVLVFFGAWRTWHLPFLFGLHALFDYGKARWLPSPMLCQDESRAWRLVNIDQALHLLQLLVVSLGARA